MTISYVYDRLYRLKEANYSDGQYFHYTYDAVGNRLTQEACIGTPTCTPVTTSYDYASYLNQWIQPDPIIGQFTNPQTLNRYAYVNNDPINRIDPSGMQCQGPSCPPPIATPPPTSTPVPGVPPQSTPVAPRIARPIEDVLQPQTCLIPSGPGAVQVPCYPGSGDLPEHGGYILGFVGSIAAFPGSGLFGGAWQQDACKYFGTAAVGAEIVYDFRHQERGFFTYKAAGETLGLLLSGSSGLYEGLTSSFSKGVSDYRGSSASAGISVSLPGVRLSPYAGVSAAMPINSDGSINPQGVYAVYFGKGLTGGASWPINVSFLQSAYEPRSEYFMDYNGGVPRQNYIDTRKAAADRMAAEIRSAAIVNNSHFVAEAIKALYDWVNYR